MGDVAGGRARDPRSPLTPPPSAPPCTPYSGTISDDDTKPTPRDGRESPQRSWRGPRKVSDETKPAPESPKPELSRTRSSEERIMEALEELRGVMLERVRSMSIHSVESTKRPQKE